MPSRNHGRQISRSARSAGPKQIPNSGTSSTARASEAGTTSVPAASGMRGVYRCGRGKWKSQIQVNGVQHYLGVYDTREEAFQAYLMASERFGRTVDVSVGMMSINSPSSTSTSVSTTATTTNLNTATATAGINTGTSYTERELIRRRQHLSTIPPTTTVEAAIPFHDEYPLHKTKKRRVASSRTLLVRGQKHAESNIVNMQAVVGANQGGSFCDGHVGNGEYVLTNVPVSVDGEGTVTLVVPADELEKIQYKIELGRALLAIKRISDEEEEEGEEEEEDGDSPEVESTYYVGGGSEPARGILPSAVTKEGVTSAEDSDSDSDSGDDNDDDIFTFASSGSIFRDIRDYNGTLHQIGPVPVDMYLPSSSSLSSSSLIIQSVQVSASSQASTSTPQVSTPTTTIKTETTAATTTTTTTTTTTKKKKPSRNCASLLAREHDRTVLWGKLTGSLRALGVIETATSPSTSKA